MMLAAWGEANSFATEALGHIRTVKAFVSEPLEIAKVNTGTRYGAARHAGYRTKTTVRKKQGVADCV